MRATTNYIRWFDEIGIEDIPLVGGKNASLGEMYQVLTPQGIKIPNGFTITADAYRHVLWSALLARHFGSSSIENRVAYAIVVGEANEKCDENSEAITKMDTHNNSIGISIFKENVVQGEKPSLKEIRQFIIQLLENAQYIPIDSVTIKKIMSVDETQMVFLEN